MAWSFACVAALCGASPTRAQSAADLHAAATAFQEGQRAQLRGDFAQAAELFDLANRTAPSAAALRSSIRMHQSAGHHARAATLAAEARALYASDATTTALADEVLAALTPSLGRVLVRCEPECALTADARVVSTAVSTTLLYVDPGAHELVASWGSQAVQRSAEPAAGAQVELVLRRDDALAPEPVTAEPVASPEPTAPVSSPSSSQPSDDGRENGLSPVFLAIGAGLTVASLVGTVAVGVDMLGARDRYVAMPTEAGWRDGVARETATNALLGTTIGLAAVTTALAIFTDWGGGETDALRVLVVPCPDGAFTDVTARF